MESDVEATRVGGERLQPAKPDLSRVAGDDEGPTPLLTEAEGAGMDLDGVGAERCWRRAPGARDETAKPQARRPGHNIIHRYFEIVNMYPKITDAELAKKIEEFTMNAPADQLLRMQSMVIAEGAGYMADDPRWREILDRLDGIRIGMAIGDEYRTTVSLADRRFTVAMGINDRSVPVLSVASREDYVDALLRRKDLLWVVVSGKLKASHKMKLARWGLTFIEHLKDDELFEDLVSHQSSAEEKILEAIQQMS